MWEKVISKDSGLSTYETLSICGALFPKSQYDLAVPYLEKFFIDMIKVFNEKARDSRDGIYFYLSPFKFVGDETFKTVEKAMRDIATN